MRTRTAVAGQADPFPGGIETAPVAVVAPAARRASLVGALEAGGFVPSIGDDSAGAVVVAGRATADDRHLVRARSEYPEVPIVLVTSSATPVDARRLLVDGIAGLVLEADLEDALSATVLAVLAGQIAYPAELMPQRLRAALSTREKQILGMVVLGLSNAEIAAKLFVSESTVKSHLSSAFTTMGVRSRREAVSLILDPDAGFGAGILGITDAA